MKVKTYIKMRLASSFNKPACMVDISLAEKKYEPYISLLIQNMKPPQHNENYTCGTNIKVIPLSSSKSPACMVAIWFPDKSSTCMAALLAVKEPSGK